MCDFVTACREHYERRYKQPGDHRRDLVWMLLSICAARNLAKPGQEKEMNSDYIISALIALLLLAYLVYAMLKPERF